MDTNYYDLLQVARDASTDTIRLGYRKQAMRWHPDRNPGSGEAEQRFKMISEAYAVLRDPASRRDYDEALSAGQAEQTYHGKHFDPRAAADAFLQEMMGLAYELTMQNVKWSKIASALKEKGCPASVAEAISRGVDKHRKAAVRRSAGRSLLLAVGSIALGGIITAISYSAASAGGRYLVTGGLFLYGVVNIVRALYFLATGRVPNG